MKSVKLGKAAPSSGQPDPQISSSWYLSFLPQVSLSLDGAVNNMIRRYGALDTVFSQAEYTDPDGRRRNRHEILPDRYLRSGRYCGGMHPDCGLAISEQGVKTGHFRS